jgi:Fic family protein
VFKKGGFVDMSEMVWQPGVAWNSLPKLAALTTDVETASVLRKCIGARTALAELKQASAMIPDSTMLINTLPMLEAQASSEIENIVTTADELFRHVSAEAGATPATREALRYRSALREGFEELTLRPITTRTAEKVCSRIKGVDMTVRRVPGTTLANPSTGDIIYTPPEGEPTLRELLADWERFQHDTGRFDPLVRMAMAHYQFEAIHPFTDGNGRTGRILNSLYLVEQDLLPLPVLYLSRYIIQNKSEYYRLLLGVTRDAQWEPWILYMLTAVEETSRWTLAKIQAIRELATITGQHVRDRRPKIYTRELVDVIFCQPYCRIANLVDARIVGRQTAAKYLNELESIGVLKEVAAGKERLFVHTRLLRLLTSEDNSVERYA